MVFSYSAGRSAISSLSKNKRTRMKKAVRDAVSAPLKKNAEEQQDEYQATKVVRTQRGERRLRRVPVYNYVPETKFKINSADLGTIPLDSSAIATQNLIIMNRGTGNQDARIGDKIQVSSILSRIALGMDASVAPGISHVVRVMLVYDRQSNGANVDTAKLFQTNSVYSPLNSDNAGRYRVIWDKLVVLNSQSSSQAVLITQNNIFKNGLPVHYDADTGAIANIQKGNIALVYMYDAIATTGTPAAPKISYDIKISYKDL